MANSSAEINPKNNPLISCHGAGATEFKFMLPELLHHSTHWVNLLQICLFGWSTMTKISKYCPKNYEAFLPKLISHRTSLIAEEVGINEAGRKIQKETDT